MIPIRFGGGKKPEKAMSNAEKIYHMLTPKPKALLEKSRKLVRHGELIYFSPNTMSKKPRYFFLFEDCLLIAKRTGPKKFLLRLWMYLRPGVKIYPMRDSPIFEFRILVPVKGSVKSSKQRRIIIYGNSKQQKDEWIRDIAYCLWICSGKKGPDPSGKATNSSSNANIYAKDGDGDEGEDMREGFEEDDDDDAELEKKRKAKAAADAKKKELQKKKDEAKASAKKTKDDEAKAKAAAKRAKEEEEAKKKAKEEEEKEDDLSYSSASDEEEPSIQDSNTNDLLVLFEPDTKGGKSGEGGSSSSASASTDQSNTANSTLFTDFDPFKSNTSGTATTNQQGGLYGYPQQGTVPGSGGFPSGGFPSGGFPSGGFPGFPTTGAPGSGGFGQSPFGYPTGLPPGQIMYTAQGVPVWVPAQMIPSNFPTTTTTTSTTTTGGTPPSSTSTPTFATGTDVLGSPFLVGSTNTNNTQGLNYSPFMTGTMPSTFVTNTSSTPSSASTSSLSSGLSTFPSSSTSTSSTSPSSSSGGSPFVTTSANVKELSGKDMEELAQKELQAALAAIESLTRQLESRPRKTIHKTADAEVTFDDVSDAILDATQAISAAASALLKSAAVAQRERADQVSESGDNAKYHADSVWAQGLISASHFVVAATQHLVVTADNVIKGKEKHENLVAAAAGVTAATAQLVAAHRAKADPKTKSSADLEAAATGITKATARLVQAAQMAITPIEVEDKIHTDERFTLTEMHKKKLETKARVLELEKEAEKARQELQELNKKEYKG